MEEETKELGTMIRKPFKGNRINITVIEKTDNLVIQKLVTLLDKYNLKANIVFNHYGRPNKCKRELDKWFSISVKDEGLIGKLQHADYVLEEQKPIIKQGEPIIDKLKRADEILLGKRKM